MQIYLSTNVLIFIFIWHTSVTSVYSCVFQQKVGNRYERGSSDEYKRDESDDCTCGQDDILGSKEESDFAYNVPEKDWHLYIFVIDDNQVLLRSCTGTVINSNMVLTSQTCLRLSNKMVPPYGWMVNLKNAEEFTAFAKPTNLQVSELGSYPVPDPDSVLPVADVVYNSRWINEKRSKGISHDDIAIIIIETEKTLLKKAQICLPAQVDQFDPTGYKGYYYGLGGILEADPSPESKFAADLVIMPGKLCDEENGYPGYSKEDTLCAQYRLLSPTTTGGPLVMAKDGKVSKRGFTTGKQVFLIGIAAVADKKPQNPISTIQTTYFTNILPLIPYINDHARQAKSIWCKNPPKIKLGKKVDPKTGLLKKYEWEGKDSIKRDESLDCVCGIHNLETSAQGRIVGGQEAVPYELPWMVFWYSVHTPYPEEKGDGESGCGGSIINDRMILTAAHCVISETRVGKYKSEEIIPDKIQIEYRIHLYDLDPKRQTVKVKNIYYTEDYVNEVRQMWEYTHVPYADIALVELETPIAFSTVKLHGQAKAGDVRPICLPSPERKIKVEGKMATVAGWGVQPEFRGQHPHDWVWSDKLFKLEVPIHNIEECAKRNWVVLSDSVICAGYWDKYRDSSEGDSGGPLAIRSDNGYWTQVGLVSYDSDNWEYYYESSNPADEKVRFTDVVSLYANLQKYIRFVDYYANKVGAKWCKSYV